MENRTTLGRDKKDIVPCQKSKAAPKDGFATTFDWVLIMSCQLFFWHFHRLIALFDLRPDARVIALKLAIGGL